MKTIFAAIFIALALGTAPAIADDSCQSRARVDQTIRDSERKPSLRKIVEGQAAKDLVNALGGPGDAVDRVELYVDKEGDIWIVAFRGDCFVGGTVISPGQSADVDALLK